MEISVIKTAINSLKTDLESFKKEIKKEIGSDLDLMPRRTIQQHHTKVKLSNFFFFYVHREIEFCNDIFFRPTSKDATRMNNSGSM